MAASALKIPYTQQFAPASTPLHKLLGILRQHQGNRKQLADAIASAFFGTTKTPVKMAKNTLIALKYHGIIDDDVNATQLGSEMLNASSTALALDMLAKNILLKLDGIPFVETLREMKQSASSIGLTTLADELKVRGFEVNDNSSDLSGVLGWLREAKVLDDYDVNEQRYSELVGVSPKIIEALKELTEAQILFLRALLALGTNDWIEHNAVVRHAEALYAGEVSYNWKAIDSTVLQPLSKRGLIEFRKAPKTSTGARGGKAAEVKTTEKFEKEIAEPILEPMYKSAGFREVRKIRSIPLATLVASIKQRDDENLRGESLEILAIRICQLLDLDFMGWRETDEELAGGGEVDGFMHTARLVYSRWQIQCKASDKIVLEAIAKEVGVSEITLANVILIVSTGTMTDGAKTYRQKIISKNPLNIVVVDGQQLDAIVENPAIITSILKAQAQDAMQSKPQPASLIRKTINRGNDSGGGGIASPEPAPPRQPDNPPDSESPTLFQPYYSTANGSMYMGDAYDVLRWLIKQGVRVKLLFTSPPFALIKKKAYGNEDQEQYVAWFMRFAPLFKQILEPDGSFVMDIGGSWIPGIPSRSIYQYKLLLKLCESGFYLAQEFYHYNPARLPTPAEWVTVRRIRVKDAMNNVWWFTKQPFVDSDNRRVLREYSESMKDLIKNGYKAKLRPSGHDISTKFNVDRGGSIPPNLLQLSNTESNSHYLRECGRAGIKPHPARFPIGLPDFFIKFLTRPGDLVLDPFAGSNVTGESAELLGRRWIASEISEEYVKGSRFRFTKAAKPELPKVESSTTRKPKTRYGSLFSSGDSQQFAML
ncbi:MAG TPA: DNA methyltransferase [Tepidisphaeraceae bacterium]|jgi:site-specific DNA-methyltransferase (cytosine-N4-specific)|nr:DNA methyltransferase [Tepidisphaeraceae bacterium]